MVWNAWRLGGITAIYCLFVYLDVHILKQMLWVKATWIETNLSLALDNEMDMICQYCADMLQLHIRVMNSELCLQDVTAGLVLHLRLYFWEIMYKGFW